MSNMPDSTGFHVVRPQQLRYICTAFLHTYSVGKTWLHVFTVIPDQESVSHLEMETENGNASVTGVEQLHFSKPNTESRLSLSEHEKQGEKV